MDEPRIPEHLTTSVVRSHFHNIENRDIFDAESFSELEQLLYNYPERSFYVFLQKHASLSEPLRAAIDNSDILIVQTDLEYYRHPGSPRNFIRIRHGAMVFGWQQELKSTATEYIRFALALSERKRRVLEIEQHLNTQSQRSSSPIKLEPNIWGIGVDLRKLWAAINRKLRGNKS